MILLPITIELPGDVMERIQYLATESRMKPEAVASMLLAMAVRRQASESLEKADRCRDE